MIILKLGFLLLLVAGPFFLIIGIHPGFGRVVAVRWFEMLVGVLMKQVAVALTLSCGMLGAEEGAHVSWRESAFGFRRVTAGAAGVVVPVGARSLHAL